MGNRISDVAEEIDVEGVEEVNRLTDKMAECIGEGLIHSSIIVLACLQLASKAQVAAMGYTNVQAIDSLIDALKVIREHEVQSSNRLS